MPASAAPQAGGQSPWLQEPPPSGIKTIRILTPGGKPITQARAWVFDRPQSARKGRAQALAVEHGAVKIDLSKYEGVIVLVVESPGFGLSFERKWPSDKPNADFVMRPSTRVEGRLLLPNGRPAAGIRVFPTLLLNALQPPRPDADESAATFAFLQLDDPKLRDRYTAVTGQNGRFTLRGLSQRFAARFDTDDTRFATFSMGTQVSTSGHPVTAAPDIRLTRAATIEGRVLQDGKPVGGVTIGCQSDGGWGESISDAAGRYRIERLVPGTYNVATALTVAQEDRFTASAHEAVVVRAGEHKVGFDFALIPGAVIKGRVTRADGSPAAGIPVGVYGPAHPKSGAWVQGTTADKNGYYRLRVPAGEQFVFIPVKQYDQSRDVTVKDGEEQEVDFTVP
jgi:hypothetical protein